jgi:hypothetical protein
MISGVLARVRGLRRQRARPADSDGFKLWFTNKTEAAFRRSFQTAPEADLIPSLYALLLRAGSDGTIDAATADAEDAEALRVYLRIAKRQGMRTMAISYRIAICAAIDDMRIRQAREAALAKAETGTSR